MSISISWDWCSEFHTKVIDAPSSRYQVSTSAIKTRLVLTVFFLLLSLLLWLWLLSLLATRYGMAKGSEGGRTGQDIDGPEMMRFGRELNETAENVWVKPVTHLLICWRVNSNDVPGWWWFTPDLIHPDLLVFFIEDLLNLLLAV